MISAIRSPLQSFIEHPRVQNAIITLILINAVLLGMETSSSIMQQAGQLIVAVDRIILAVFVIEIILRITVYGRDFWRDPWSLFDFGVVAIALIPASGPFAVLRALRVLRVLRLLTMVPSMRRVVGALVGAIPGLGSIGVMLLIFYYVFAVIATTLFGATYPEWFGSLGKSFYTLFQIMTLESWSMGIVRPVMESFPYAWAFFVPFILIANFTMLNLFISINVSDMQSYSEEEHRETVDAVKATQDHIETDLHKEVQSLRGEISELKQLMINNPRSD